MKLKEEKIDLPTELKQIQEKFVSSYEAFKGNRTLIWKNNLGQVTIDIEMNEQTVEFKVTPIQAAIIMKFQEKDIWSLKDLGQSLKICSVALRKKIAFWKVQNVLEEINNSNNQTEQSDPANEIYTLVKESSKV